MKDSITITPLNRNSGLYSQQLATLRPYHTTWNLVTYINTNGLRARRMQLLENLEAVKAYCNKLATACSVSGQLATLRTRLTSTEKTESTLEQLLPPAGETTKRTKRAPFRFVGKINKILYGTMDADDAERIAGQIESLENTTLNLAEIVQNQTHIIRSSFDITQRQIKSLTQTLDAETNKIRMELLALKKEIHTIRYNQKAIEFTTMIETDLTELEIDTETLINAILFAKTGQIHPEVLSSETILTSAEAIVKTLTNTEFPIPLDLKFLPELIATIDLTVFHSEDKLIYNIKIPLLDLTHYAVFQHLSVPVRQLDTNSRFAFIKPSHEFTAISEDFGNYFHLNSLKQCKFVNPRYICEQVGPIQHVNELAGCEVQLIVNPQFKTLENCDVRLKLLKQTYWSRIPNTNAWLYATPKAEPLYAICDTHESTVKIIENSGILQINPNCYARTESVRLTPSVELTSSTHVNFSQKIALNITTMVKEAIQTAESLNLTEILTETEAFTRLIEPNNIESELTQNEVSLKAIISKAKEVVKTRHTNNRLSFLESILKFTGISAASILAICMGWRFSILGKVVKIYRLMSCLSKRTNSTTRLQDQTNDQQTQRIQYHTQPIQIMETPLTTPHFQLVALPEQHRTQTRQALAITYPDPNIAP